jgi:replicative DNA helicase
VLDEKILSYGLLDKRCLLEMQTSIPVEYFHIKYQLFYSFLLRCFRKYKEIPTLAVMQAVAKNAWGPTQEEIFDTISGKEPDIKEFQLDIERFKERYNTQILLQLGEEVYQQNREGNQFKNLEDANTKIKQLAIKLKTIYQSKVFKEGSLKSTVEEAWLQYKETKDNPNAAKGIHVGFREFDRITNGIQPAELILIGGESSAGKSTVAMNMAINAWLGQNKIPEHPDLVGDFKEGGANILFFSIEMPYKSMRRRCDACMAGIPLYGVRDGCLTPEQENKFKATLKFQHKYKKEFYILDIPRGCTMAMLENKYLEMCYSFVPDLIVVDYVSLMALDKEQGADWLNLGRLSEELHEFCRTYNVPIISPVQLTRPPKNGNGGTQPPDQHRVGRSIMLPQNANILLNIETRKDEELKRDLIIRISKMRDGEKGEFILQKRFDIMRVFDVVPGWEPIDYEGVEDEKDND